MNNHDLTGRFLLRGLKLTHLRMIDAFAKTAHLGQAAQALGITQPAASRLLAEVERICGYSVHTRLGRGVELTEVGRALAQRAAHILLELQDAAREIDALGQGSQGQVAIGAVTAPALDIVLPSLRQVERAYPAIEIEVMVAPSDQLFAQLLEGKLDFIIARIPKGANAALVLAETVAGEPVDFLVRQSHPLAQKRRIVMDDLLPFDWVLPSQGNLLTDTVLARLAQMGYDAPKQRLRTASFLLTLALVQQSDAIAPLSSAVATQFCSNGDLVRLPIDLGVVVAPYSVLTRRGAVMSLAARNVLNTVRSFIAQL